MHRKGIIHSAFFLAAVFICIIGGCSKKSITDKKERGVADRFFIGYCINKLEDSFQVSLLEVVREQVIAAGGELEVQSAGEDSAKQRNQIKNFLARNVDALIVVPVNTNDMHEVTEEAVGAGIPICYLNRNPFSGHEEDIPDGVYYIGSKEIVAGELQADRAGKLLKGEGNVTILKGPESNEATHERTRGNKRIFTAKYPNIRIIDEANADWEKEKAYDITQQWIKTYGKKLHAILANNDDMALGAIDVLQQQGITNIFVLGIDATIYARAAVQSGSMAATIFQDAAMQGRTAVNIILQAIRGETPQKITWVPFHLVDRNFLLDEVEEP